MKPFTKREDEILGLLEDAYPMKIMASKLNISIHTVRTHIAKIHVKTDTHTIPELMNWIKKFRNL